MGPDFEIDLRGESCPYPVIHTLEALNSIPPGAVLRVSVDCPQAYRNVPDDAVAAGHTLLAAPERDGATMTYLLQRGPAAEPEFAAGHNVANPGSPPKPSDPEPAPGPARRRRRGGFWRIPPFRA